MEKKIYTVPEAAKAFGCAPEDLREAIRSGLLPGQMHHNIGDYMIRAEDLAAYLRLKKTDLKVSDKIKVLVIDDEVNFANIVKLELERDPRLLVRYISLASLVGRIVPLPLVFRQGILGHLQGQVGNGEGQVQKEGPLPVFLDEGQGFLLEQVLGIVLAGGAGIVALQRHPLLVFPEVFGVMVVGMTLAVVAEEKVEALP